MAKESEKIDKILEIITRHDEKLLTIREDLVEIKVQTTKTNGRVNILEAWRIGFKAQLAIVIGIISFSATIAWELIKPLLIK